MVYRITAEVLTDMGACKLYVSPFEQLFPQGAILNRANLKKALSKGLPAQWLFKVCANEDSWSRLSRDIDAVEDMPGFVAWRRRARRHRRKMPCAYRVAVKETTEAIMIEHIMKCKELRAWLRDAMHSIRQKNFKPNYYRGSYGGFKR